MMRPGIAVLLGANALNCLTIGLNALSAPSISGDPIAPTVPVVPLWNFCAAAVAVVYLQPIQPWLRQTAVRRLALIDLPRALLMVFTMACTSWATAAAGSRAHAAAVTVGLLGILMTARRLIGTSAALVVAVAWLGYEFAFGQQLVRGVDSADDPWAPDRWHWKSWTWALNDAAPVWVPLAIGCVGLIAVLVTTRPRWADRG